MKCKTATEYFDLKKNKNNSQMGNSDIAGLWRNECTSGDGGLPRRAAKIRITLIFKYNNCSNFDSATLMQKQIDTDHCK